MNTKDFNKTLTNLTKDFNFRPLLNYIRQLIIEDTEYRFALELTPDNDTWDRLKDPKRKKYKNLPILHEELRLKKSVTQINAEYNINKVTKDRLEWGTEDPKALTHQNGDPSRNIAQREFLGIGLELEKQIEDEVALFMEQEIIKRLS